MARSSIFPQFLLAAFMALTLVMGPSVLADKPRLTTSCRDDLSLNGGLDFSKPLFKQFFSYTLGEVDRRISDKPRPLGAAAVGEIDSSELRGWMFRLNGLVDIYRQSDPKALDKLEVPFASLEESFGNHSQLVLYVREAKKGGLPDDEIDRLTNKKAKAERKLYEKMRVDGWLSTDGEPSRAEIIADEINGLAAWTTPALERKFIIHTLAADLAELDAEITNGDYTNADIEKGLHKLRRKIRKILMKISTLSGLTARSDDPQSADVAKLFGTLTRELPKIINDKYVRLPRATADWQIHIPFELHVILAYYVFQLGEIKDSIEAHDFFTQELKDAGYSRSEIDRIVKKAIAKNKLPSLDVDPKKYARDVQAQLTDAKILKRLRKALEAQIDPY